MKNELILLGRVSSHTFGSGSKSTDSPAGGCDLGTLQRSTCP